MTFEDLQKLTLEWAKDKKLLDIRNVDKQFMKFIEEGFEFKTEMDTRSLRWALGESEDDIYDDIKLEMGDIFVTLIILCKQLGLDPLICLDMAYKKISKRTGKTINGQFIKSEDL